MPSTQPRETTISRKDSDIKIDHATLNVYDLDVSEAFYREALGLSVAHESLHPC
jgi:catechol-2,3-dioxygenase